MQLCLYLCSTDMFDRSRACFVIWCYIAFSSAYVKNCGTENVLVMRQPNTAVVSLIISYLTKSWKLNQTFLFLNRISMENFGFWGMGKFILSSCSRMWYWACLLCWSIGFFSQQKVEVNWNGLLLPQSESLSCWPNCQKSEGYLSFKTFQLPPKILEHEVCWVPIGYKI